MSTTVLPKSFEKKTIQYEIEGYAVALDGCKIYYNVQGTGHTVFALIDGIACDGFIWKYFRQEFAGDCRIVFYNLRGHGKSGKPYDYHNLTIPVLATDLKIVLDALRVQKCILVGYSMGVQIALEFAHLFPRTTQALVLVCGSYQYPIDTFKDSATLKKMFPLIYHIFTRYSRLAEPIWRTINLSPLAPEMARFLEGNPRLVKREDIEPYFKHLATLELELFARMLNFASSHTADPYLPDIKMPALVVAGDKDSFTPVWISKLMVERLPNAELLVVREGSHIAYLEHPELINAAIRRFVKKAAQNSI